MAMQSTHKYRQNNVCVCLCVCALQMQSSDEQPLDVELPSSKLPPFFAPIIPPPPFPLLSISTTPPFIQPPPRKAHTNLHAETFARAYILLVILSLEKI